MGIFPLRRRAALAAKGSASGRSPMTTVIRLVVALAAVALAMSVAVPAADAADPTLRVTLKLEGRVPANAAFSNGIGTSGSWICLPASASRTWAPGSATVPACEMGLTYVVIEDQTPKGAIVDVSIFLDFCRDKACGETVGPRTVWHRTITMGGARKNIPLTFTFRDAPDTSTSVNQAASPTPATLLAAYFVAVVVAVAARRLVGRRRMGHAQRHWAG